MIGIPVSMRTAGLCYTCGGRTQGWLIFCECRCGSSHGVCMKCLDAARKIGLIRSRLVQTDHDAEHGGKITMRFEDNTFKRCPSSEEVKIALVIGR